MLFGVSTLVFLLLVMIPVTRSTWCSANRRRQPIASDARRPRSRPAIAGTLAAIYADLAHGDLGDSLVRLQPVTDLIRQRLPATLQLAAAAFVLVLLIALPLGIIAARHRGRWPDSLAQTFAPLVGVSIPEFWLGPLLVLLFSVYLGWTPVSGQSQSPAAWFCRRSPRPVDGRDHHAHDAQAAVCSRSSHSLSCTARCKGWAKAR